jgi:Factor for inversion stimulation Fis, transcriptional activator
VPLLRLFAATQTVQPRELRGCGGGGDYEGLSLGVPNSGSTSAMNQQSEKSMDEKNKVIPMRVERRTQPFQSCVRIALNNYFKDLDGHEARRLYALVLKEMEAALFDTVMHYSGGNQTRAAEILGINRGTLRKKLKQYRLG